LIEHLKILTSWLFADRVFQFHTQQFASIRQITTLHRCNILYLQPGGGNFVDKIS